MIRKKDLGKGGDPNRTPADAVRDAVVFVRQKHPDAQPEYDKAFFGVERSAAEPTTAPALSKWKPGR